MNTLNSAAVGTHLYADQYTVVSVRKLLHLEEEATNAEVQATMAALNAARLRKSLNLPINASEVEVEIAIYEKTGLWIS